MDTIEKVISLFHSSIEAKATYGESLAPLLVNASEKITNTFINDGKVILCGDSKCSISAQHFANIFLNQGNRERPALPAIVLDNSPSTITSISNDYGPGEVLSRQIRALGQAGDLLLIFTLDGTAQGLVNAVQDAHDRGMQVISFSGYDGGHIVQLLDNNDLEIRFPVEQHALIHEMHLQSIYILSELIDDQLFGGTE